MGLLMRRYWLPAIMSEELQAGGAPKRVRLLGEDLVAFRDPEGRVGLLEESCPHRGASLAIARNESCGLRCLYHGWKIDVDGRILEMPSEPDPHLFIDKVRAKAYRVHEAGGLVWAYMGPPEHAPAPMDFEFTHLPGSHSVIVKTQIDCNWAQCLEGVIDSSHTNFLHADTFSPAPGLDVSIYKGDSLKVDRPSMDPAPRLEVQNTPYGFRYAAIRKTLVNPDQKTYVRVTLFVAPIYGMFPGQKGWGAFQAFVPIDDERTMLYFVRYAFERPVDERERQFHAAWSGLRPGLDIDGEHRRFRNRHNNWLQDRDAMKRGESYSGVVGVQTEDAMVQESMGPIYNRSKEHLGTGDMAVVRMRRLLLNSVKRLMEKGEAPIGLGASVPYGKLRAEEKIIPLATPWQTVGAYAGEPADA
jgi:phthalate 4,5-dioxygenase oxygenase subunit